MTIFTTFTVEGTAYEDATDITVNRTLNEFNGTASFTARIPNKFGTFKDTFNLNDDVVIKAGTSENPTEVLFGGVVENVELQGTGTNQMLLLRGRDYGSLMQDTTVDPIVYRDKEISAIVKSIIAGNIPEITVNNVDVTTTTLERMAFSHDDVWDAISQLAKFSGFYFYIDEDKDLHFLERDTVSSGETFDNTNTLSAKFTTQDRDIYNDVWVYGARILTQSNDQFTADGAGSVFTVSDNPHNIAVFENDLLISPGGVIAVDNPGNEDVKYLVDFDKREIVFASGTTAGDNLPVSGNFISIDYDKLTPIISRKQDSVSQSDYGIKTKIISEAKISSFQQAQTTSASFLSENKDPRIQANVKLADYKTLVPGETAVLNVPDLNINSQTYRIVSINYKLTGVTEQTENAISLRMNLKVDDINDTIKELILRLAALERGNLNKNLTNFEQVTNNIEVQNHWEAYDYSGTLHAFRFHRGGHSRFDSPHAVLSPWNLGSTLLESGGDF